MTQHLKNTKTLSTKLFWDVDPNSIDIKKHQQFILERVLNYGTIDNLKEIFLIYGHQEIFKTAIRLKKLSKKSLNFVSFYFSIPKENFVCYSKKPLKNQHWNY